MPYLTIMKRCTRKTSSQGSESLQTAHTTPGLAGDRAPFKQYCVSPFFNLLKSRDITEVLYLGAFSSPKANIQIKQKKNERREEGKERRLCALCQPIKFNRKKDTSGYSFL